MDAFLRGQSSTASSSKLKQQTGEETAGSSNKRVVVPWVEKYRPRSVDEVAYQDEVVSVLKKSLEGADLPNLLFYGPPGTGKTSTILAIARQLFGPELMRSRVLELNASDERGIQVVRDKVKKFAQLAASGIRTDGTPCPPFKLVILDEADSMTPSAQAALRRTMEKETKTTRFCLICNYAIQELIKISEGDMRKAITYLQSAQRLKGEDVVEADDISEIAGVVPSKMADKLFEACGSDSFEKLDATVQEIIAEGHAAAQVINQVHDRIIEMADLNDHQKSAIMEKIAIVDKCLCDGADEYLQILSLCSVMMQQFCHAGQT
ncbi:hypothetical protein pdam_00007989 [Pocillopora damicornis]|uniref:AAA+ ATPase domain-containing protein n=1 Tax=Pocillopora damicornis TaxID=46731 RepID=A0A3M6U4Y1_POCDA|nr:hypothetical protein pdam_00007989 [Pocillopora damicornis]